MQMQLDAKGIIPKYVLVSKVQFWRPVRRVFLQAMLTGLLERIHESYLERSHLDDEPDLRSNKAGFSPKMGRADSLGNTWEQLKPVTYRTKKNQADEFGQGDNYDSRYIRHRKSINSKSVQSRAEQVHAILEDIDFDADGINIRTGQLLEGYTPPYIGENQQAYFSKYQQIIIDDNDGNLKISFTNTAPHAEDVNAGKRPVVKDEWMQTWLYESQDEAIQAASIKYEQLKQIRDLTNERRREKRRKQRVENKKRQIAELIKRRRKKS